MNIGRHAIADIYNCNINNMDDIDNIKTIIIEAAKEANLHIVDMVFHKFNPIGISGVLVLAESHLTIHTWPEYNFIAVDVFTCGSRFNPKEACEVIANKFNSNKYKIREVERGKNYGLSRIRNQNIEHK